MIYASNIKHKNIFLFQKRNKKKLLCYVLIHISLFFFWSLNPLGYWKNRGFFPYFANSADTGFKKQNNPWYIHQTSNIKKFFCFKIFYVMLRCNITINFFLLYFFITKKNYQKKSFIIFFVLISYKKKLNNFQDFEG